MKRETVSLINVKSCNALVLMQLVHIRSYLSNISSEISVINFGYTSPGHVSKDVKIRGYFTKPKRGSRAK
jgi:hypothetical protein